MFTYRTEIYETMHICYAGCLLPGHVTAKAHEK